MTETHTVGVTGAAGYIGSRVTADLLDAGHDVVAVDDFSAAKVDSIPGVDVVDADVCDADVLREQFADVDAVFHLAAMTHVGDCEDRPADAFDVNVRGTETVAWFCRERGLPLVFPCSMAIVGDPVETPVTASHPRGPANFYGRTKKMSEDDIHDLAPGSFPAHVYMKSNLYGNHAVGGERVGKRTVINIFVEKALAGDALTVHEPGTQARDFVHVEDVASAYLLSLDELVGADPGARTLPLASGESLSILGLAELVQRVAAEELGRDVDIELVENPRSGAEPSDDLVVDTDDARDAIGFDAERTVEGTVREMLRANAGSDAAGDAEGGD
ncbi:NAD-dependent epimerase/dehydratase family protein [Halobaculum sp. D14]|uniref:NAD-dependent epimerase/dehydratase family protein n=1 Tax=Halobaculum sp. D14 TaxID=3421642 RepID=UPI003EB7456C